MDSVMAPAPDLLLDPAPIVTSVETPSKSHVAIMNSMAFDTNLLPDQESPPMVVESTTKSQIAVVCVTIVNSIMASDLNLLPSSADVATTRS